MKLFKKETMKTIKNKITGFDMFGRPVELSFNSKGHEHKTFCGGLAGLLVRLIMLTYIVILLHKTLHNSKD